MNGLQDKFYERSKRNLPWAKFLKKYRLSTTISLRHYAMLKRHMQKYETQQKVIETSLENLDNGVIPVASLSDEEKLWLMVRNLKSVCTIPRESFKVLLETFDADRYRVYVAEKKPLEYLLEVYYQRPLSECGLGEIVDGLVKLYKISNLVDTIEYSDDGELYTLKMLHDLGLNNSRMLKASNEGLFTSYGAYVNYTVSDRSLFTKIYKIP